MTKKTAEDLETAPAKPTAEELGSRAYTYYFAAAGGISQSGLALPPFGALDTRAQLAWMEVARVLGK
jgi:hypothetical protein